MYYRKANAAMLIYDITDSDSFYDIKDWISGRSRSITTPYYMYMYILSLEACHEKVCFLHM